MFILFDGLNKEIECYYCSGSCTVTGAMEQHCVTYAGERLFLQLHAGNDNEGSDRGLGYYRGLPRRSGIEFSIMLRLVRSVRVIPLFVDSTIEDTKLRSEKRARCRT